MKNVTITVDERVARWAKVWAAKQGSSVSRLVGQLLEERMNQDRSWASAMRRDLARRPVLLKKSGGYPARDELHDRTGLR